MANRKKTGGRVAGTPNKVTATVKALAAKAAPEAIKVLVSVTGNPRAPDAACMSAAKEILDRAAGKVPQALTDAEDYPRGTAF